MSDIIICVVLFVLIYCTLTMFYLAYRLAVMMDGLEKFLTDIKANGVHNDKMAPLEVFCVSILSILATCIVAKSS